MLPPMTPINPYLGANTSVHLHTLWSLSLELNRVPGVLLEPYMSQGGSGERRAPQGIERVNGSFGINAKEPM